MNLSQSFKPAPGRIAVIRDQADEFWSKEFGWVKVDDTKDAETRWNPWALVVGVGAPRTTDYGTSVMTDTLPGDRVLIGEIGRSVVLKTDDQQAGSIYVLPFEGILGRLEWTCATCNAKPRGAYEEYVPHRSMPEGGVCPACPTLVTPTNQEVTLVGLTR